MSISTSCHIIPQYEHEHLLQVYRAKAEKAAEEGDPKLDYWNNRLKAQIASMNRTFYNNNEDFWTCFNNKDPHTGGIGYTYDKDWWTGYQPGKPGSIEKRDDYLGWGNTEDNCETERLKAMAVCSRRLMQIWDLSFLQRNPTLLMERKKDSMLLMGKIGKILGNTPSISNEPMEKWLGRTISNL